MDKLELIAQRHSARQYKDIAIEEDKRKVIDDLVSSVNSEHDLQGLECALLVPTAINQQKFYFELDGDEVKLKKQRLLYRA